ncbi:hypothetical protein L861_14400 [Litchfieldella anticariensis FP35 = DSM 16096]|uniref:Erythromycin esterase n=1 Tax=Litchfieldella anticariensis (strain DSM 16096 / CECT 5854 / CIP 108499 / LMG 22089 / FP35) TaxID=1121939 RepID=S2KYJ8_LITA3|nr:erythromycin esterase family protein [Halomonas anticariensis]EPC00459.1 hypothetical protein L861_14400 [Halomonas anticariensis FP35 = DSM 16096]
MVTPLAGIRNAAIRLDERDSDYDALLEQAAGRHFVLLGEASHGTAEFYRMRGEITRRLIEENGFEAVLVEADWPDALRLNSFVRGTSQDTLMDAFSDFQRFPQWMWRNDQVRDFILWLRDYNAGRPYADQVGFHGLDLYSLHRSADAVIDYLFREDSMAGCNARLIRWHNPRSASYTVARRDDQVLSSHRRFRSGRRRSR